MKDYQTRRLEELWTRFLERDSLELKERAELAEALERDDAFRRRMISDLQIEGALRAAGDIERGQEHVVQSVRALVTAAGRTEEVVAAVRKRLEAKLSSVSGSATPANRQRTGIGRGGAWLASATLLAAAAAAVLLFMPARDGGRRPLSTDGSEIGEPAETSASGGTRSSGRARRFGEGAPATTSSPQGRVAMARVESIEGTVYRHGPEGIVRATPALELAVGDWVSTSGAAARARLAGPGGSRIEVVGDAVLGISADPAQPTGARLFLAQGRAAANLPATTGQPALSLASPHGVVTGAGFVRLDVSGAITRVEVSSGRVRVSALGVQQATEVGARQFALVSADDLQPPRAQSTPRLALLLTGPDDTKEDPAPVGGLRGSEERLKARLERLGFQVDVLDASSLQQDRGRAASLLVFSSSVASNLLQGWLADLPVPMLVLESTGFEQLGLTGSRWKRDVGPGVPVSEITIQDPSHPLAAGLSGTVRVLNVPLNLRWTAPPSAANRIAGYTSERSLLFSYERGEPTLAGPAPARRVGLFFGNGRVIRALTDEGWRLFDAAALWAAGPPQ